ncbi:MAG: ATP-binding protein [Spirochaetaceae bacterium]
MPLRIEHVEIRNAGPLVHFATPLRALTVFHAPNERGKTTVVENLIAALFRRSRGVRMPATRDGGFIGAAEVRVRGAADEPKIFTPTSGEKLDGVLAKTPAFAEGLPPSLFNLLVIRAADTGIAEGGGGLTAASLKDLISPQRVYDKIRESFPGKVVNFTRIEDGRIVGDRKGRHKDYVEAQETLSGLERSAEQFYARMSRSGAVAKRKRLETLREEQQQLGMAKRHRAAGLAARRDELERRYTSGYDEQIRGLRENLRRYDERRESLERTRTEAERIGDPQERIRWISGAQEAYKVALRRTRNLPQRISLLAAAVLGLLSVAFYLIPGLSAAGTAAGAAGSAAAGSAAAGTVGLPLFELAAVLAVLALLVAVVATFFLQRLSTPEASRQELERLEAEFSRRFGRPLSAEHDFDAAREEESKKTGRRDELSRRMEELEPEVAELERRIVATVRELGAEAGEDWWATLGRLEGDLGRARDEISRVREELSSLGVDPSDYRQEDPGTVYSRERETEIEAEISRIEEELRREEGRFDEVKKELGDYLPSAVVWNGSLEEISAAVEDKRRELAEARDEAYYDIRAAHLVEEVLRDLQAREDQRLTDALNGSEAATLLRRLTGRYDRIIVEGEAVSIGNAEESYAFADLSTGAREQVLLALRMGIASRLLGEERLFLVLDDAFQYSDWTRRDRLVGHAVEAVKSGWQVLYFTMDDDIRDRFTRAAQRELSGDDFELVTM